MPNINVDVPKLEAVRSGFEVARAAAVAAEAVWVTQLVADLAAGFACLGTNAAKVAYDTHCIQALHKFQTLCQVGANGIDGAINAYQGTDASGATLFTGEHGGSSSDPQALGPDSPTHRIANNINMVSQRHGVPVNIDDYETGVDGWSIISTDGS